MWRWLFCGGGGEGGRFGGMPPGIFLNTLNNAFWRHIYTELWNQAILQVIIEIMFTGIKGLVFCEQNTVDVSSPAA